MPKETFEDYLKQVHFRQFPELLDDDLPDAFDSWVSGLDAQEIMEYAEDYGAKCYKEGLANS